MADLKISELTNLTAADPANDMIPIVDVSATPPASGSTKRISINNILACSPTATLASATITGDLTVDTSTLKVDSANNRVGVGTASPTDTLDVNGRVTALRYLSSSSNAALPSFAVSAGNGAYNSGTNEIGFSINSTSAMTLNATGLGVGGGPTAKISCAGYSSANQLPDINIARSSSGTTIQTGPNIVFTDGTSNNTVTLQNSQGRFGVWNYGAGSWNERLIVDSSGNVGIGVTPSAWSGGRAVDLQLYGNLNTWDDGTAAQIQAGFNFYQTGSTFKYKISSRASMYRQRLGVHSWHYDTGTQTANADCAFTQAMTLDASGNLILLSSNTPATLTTNGQLTVNATSNTNLRFSYRGSDGVTRVANITLA